MQLIVMFLYSLVAWLFSIKTAVCGLFHAVTIATHCVYVLHGCCLFLICITRLKWSLALVNILLLSSEDFCRDV